VAKPDAMKSKLRFVMVGGASTIIDFGALNLLTFAGLSPIVANSISTALAMTFSFFLNKKFTFQSKSRNYRREVLLFVIFTLFGLWVIQNLVIKGLLLVTPDSWPEFVRLNGAKIVATGFSMVWNYVTYARFVFRDVKSDESKESHN
jgi:putative flippase GtrA